MSSMITYADTSIKDNALNILKNQLEVLRLQANNVQSFVSILKDLVSLVLKELKDVKETDWYKENLALLYGMKIIEGNGQGYFLPNKEVTGSEYLKMVVVALDNKTYSPVNGKWDKPYIDRAMQLGLVKEGEISDYSKPLNRYQMARIIVRACNESFDNYNQYQSNIKDFNSIPNEYREYVLKAYSKGIINGLPDGTFAGDKTMTRAEATAVIARLIDPSQRKTPTQPTVANDLARVPLKSDAMIELYGPKGEDNPNNVDFTVLFLLYKPMESQYEDAQKLLEARFGKNNATVKEVMNYIKSKDDRKKELKLKNWTTNNQTLSVVSSPNSMTIDLTVWRDVK